MARLRDVVVVVVAGADSDAPTLVVAEGIVCDVIMFAVLFEAVVAVVAVVCVDTVAEAMVVALNSVVWKLLSIAWMPASVQQLSPPPFPNAPQAEAAAGSRSWAILLALLLPLASEASTVPLLLPISALVLLLSLPRLLLLFLVVSVAPWDHVPRTSRSNSATTEATTTTVTTTTTAVTAKAPSKQQAV